MRSVLVATCTSLAASLLIVWALPYLSQLSRTKLLILVVGLLCVSSAFEVLPPYVAPLFAAERPSVFRGVVVADGQLGVRVVTRDARPIPVARPTASRAGSGARPTAVESADDASGDPGETRMGEFVALDM